MPSKKTKKPVVKKAAKKLPAKKKAVKKKAARRFGDGDGGGRPQH